MGEKIDIKQSTFTQLSQEVIEANRPDSSSSLYGYLSFVKWIGLPDKYAYLMDASSYC